MKRIKLNFFDLDEISSREFDFSVLIIMLCIAFRNYFRGYGFAIHLTSDLFFEMTLKYTLKRTFYVSTRFSSLSANTLPFKNQWSTSPSLNNHISKL